MPLPTSNKQQQYVYNHEKTIGGQNDVLKHIVIIETIKELQKVHSTNGIIIYDLQCGDGVWDLNECATSRSIDYQKGILKLLYKCEELSKKNINDNAIPIVIQNYIKLLYKSTGCTSYTNLDVYPGSPVFIQNILRNNIDEYKAFDLYLNNIQWLRNDVQSNIKFQQIDVYQPKSISTYCSSIPLQGKHPIYIIDPPYDDENDGVDHYVQAKNLLVRILQMNMYATIIVYIPLIYNHKNRFLYSKSLKDIAKEYCKIGRYYCSINIRSDELQGSSVLVCNPTLTLDDILSDTVIHFLANSMNHGKDEYIVEQIMKKKKDKK